MRFHRDVKICDGIWDNTLKSPACAEKSVSQRYLAVFLRTVAGKHDSCNILSLHHPWHKDSSPAGRTHTSPITRAPEVPAQWQ